MIDLVRKEIADTADTFVIKIGSNVLAREDGTLDVQQLAGLVRQVHHLRAAGRRVVLVSSGAIAAGLGRLGLAKRPDDLPHLQAAAAVGQSVLMAGYDHELRRHGAHAAQILLTAEDFDNRARYLNVRNTILTLFEYGAVPIINENDTVSVDEIRFGDNDTLAAMVTPLLAAPLLVMLSVVDGLYEGLPDETLFSSPGGKEGVRGRTAEPIPLIRDIDASTLALAASSRSRLGSGGMRSKLEAARIATAAGASVILAGGRRPDVLLDILAGRPVGTLVLAQGGAAITAWKRWIGFTVRPRGHYVLDAGACTAVRLKGRSLLPAGILDVVGHFRKGDVVRLCDGQGQEFARGLTNYSAEEARQIRGLKTRQIHAALGTHPYDEVVHRDNLVLTG